MVMLTYYIELALRSLRRGPGLTALMVLAIGFGVAASMTTYAVFRAVSGNPLPEKSAQLFTPQIDNLGPQSGKAKGDLPDALTYTDAMALMQARQATRQTAIYPVGYTMVPGDVARLPFGVNGYAAYADFFPMFKVRFRYGGGWRDAEDTQRANVIVISSQLNQKLFHGSNSVGRTLNLDGHDYHISGVLGDWNPQPRFYDVNNGNGFADAPQFFLPFTRAVDLQTDTIGGNSCPAPPPPGWDGWLHSPCVWVSFWAELPDAAAAQRYRQFLTGYASEQQRSGRFNWPANVRLHDMTQWLDHEHVVPPETKVSLLVAIGFLVVCLVNTIGLLLAKIMRRAGEIGVRRALGASRGEIYRQFLVEAAMVGIGGGLLGLALTALGVVGVGLVFAPDIARLASVNAGLVGLTLLVAIAATVAAAFYPAWRAAQVQPAWQLKCN
jgi:putative ABC transport system permease protein